MQKRGQRQREEEPMKKERTPGDYYDEKRAARSAAYAKWAAADTEEPRDSAKVSRLEQAMLDAGYCGD
jgi:hypothetical protein